MASAGFSALSLAPPLLQSWGFHKGDPGTPGTQPGPTGSSGPDQTPCPGLTPVPAPKLPETEFPGAGVRGPDWGLCFHCWMGRLRPGRTGPLQLRSPTPGPTGQPRGPELMRATPRGRRPPRRPGGTSPSPVGEAPVAPGGVEGRQTREGEGGPASGPRCPRPKPGPQHTIWGPWPGCALPPPRHQVAPESTGRSLHRWTS